MTQVAPFSGTGIDRRTGKVISGWDHVLQSLEVIFTTRFGERVMRRWFGSFVPNLLGERMVPSRVLKFWTAICIAIDTWEPRYKITKIVPLGTPEGMRLGALGFEVYGLYFPKGHLGDFTVSRAKTFVAGVDNGLRIQRTVIPPLRAPVNRTLNDLPTISGGLIATDSEDVAGLSGSAGYFGDLSTAESTDLASLFGLVKVDGSLVVAGTADTPALSGTVSGDPIINMMQYYASFDQWTASGATIVQNADNEPLAGRATADRLVETSNLSQHSITPTNMSFVSGETYTFSVYAKYESAAYIQLLFGSAAFGSNAWGNFDIQNGTLGTIGSAATGTITSVGGGWYRISITATATGTASTGAVIFGANAGAMTRAASYTGSTSNTRLLANAQVEIGATANTYVTSTPSFVGNTDGAIVGALRWDAWYHPTEDTIRTAVETSLGPSEYHWRLPFFATEPTAESAVIAGTQSDMDAEIAYAVEAGLDYWAFFWYGLSSTNGMKQAWDYYQASPNKNDVNWCLYFSGINPFNDDITNNLATIVGYLQQSNYQKTSSGRPLVFMYDDNGSKTNLAANITSLRNAATGAGLADPYIIFHQSTADATVITTYGFDATTTYAPVVSVSGAKPYNILDTTARAKWDAQATKGVDVVPSFTLGWDRRPRVDNPVPWETPGGSLSDYYYLENPVDVSVHVDAVLAWARANPTRTPQKIIIGYAWNENDEGGWIVPTLDGIGGINVDRVNALKSVLVTP